MQTATEILTEEVLDKSYWGKKIIAAENRGGFTHSNVDQSSDWVTCACGKNDLIKSMPDQRARHSDDSPNDSELRQLGTDFYHNVQNGSMDYGYNEPERQGYIIRAAQTLVDIEDRANELMIEEIARRSEQEELKASK